MSTKIDLLLKNAAEVVTCVPNPEDPIGRISGGSLAIKGGRVLEVGRFDDLQAQYDLSLARVINCTGKIVAPGFVDSHTHVVFGGTRVKEYAIRLTHSIEEVRSRGIPTGIVASMQMTREATGAALFAGALDRLQSMLRAGTTTVESKSGYGLSLEHELKMLRVNRLLQSSGHEIPEIVSTFLGAHAFPPDVDHETYVEEIIHEMIPAVVEENLAVFCDVYIDDGYFNLNQTHRVLHAGREAGLKLKIHADQYGALGGAELAAELGVVSADHLNYTKKGTMEALANAGVVGVLMPLIDFAVQHPKPFEAREMFDAGMEIALATDICPGGWTESMQLVMQFACRKHGFSPEEAIYAATVGGAKALALDDRGALASGMRADIQVWDLPTFEDVVYRFGNNAVEMVIKSGKIIFNRSEQI